MFKQICKKSISFLLLIIFFVTVNSVSADMSMNDAVNMAGKQRMLTQRMLRNYAMTGMMNEFGDPKKDLKQNVSHFDKSIKSLTDLNVNSEVNQSLNKDVRLWEEIKKTLQKPPEFKKVSGLQKDLDVLLDSCHETTELIAKVSGTSAVEIVDIAGRQRMLSQRLAALYMLQVWGVEDPEFKQKLHDTLDEFSNAQKILLESKVNTPEINAGLEKVKKLFKWFEVMGRSTSGRYVPSIIAKTSDKILKEMDAVTNLYIKAI